MLELVSVSSGWMVGKYNYERIIEYDCKEEKTSEKGQ